MQSGSPIDITEWRAWDQGWTIFRLRRGMGFRDYPCTIVSDIEEWRIDHSTERRIGADAAETCVASQRRTGTFQVRPEFATGDSWKW